MTEATDSFVIKSWLTIKQRHFNLYLTPLYWQLGWLDRRQDLGDHVYHSVHCLCLHLEYRTESEQGRRGREYQEEWNEGRSPLIIDRGFDA